MKDQSQTFALLDANASILKTAEKLIKWAALANHALMTNWEARKRLWIKVWTQVFKGSRVQMKATDSTTWKMLFRKRISKSLTQTQVNREKTWLTLLLSPHNRMRIIILRLIIWLCRRLLMPHLLRLSHHKMPLLNSFPRNLRKNKLHQTR